MPNESVRFLRLSGCGVAARADGPYRLVRNHRFLQLFRTQTSETASQLSRQYFFYISFVALLERFSDANDRTQFRFVRRAHLAIHHLVSFPKQNATFAVPEHDIPHKQIAQERSTDLAGKGAVLFPVHVLRADLYILSIA